MVGKLTGHTRSLCVVIVIFGWICVILSIMKPATKSTLCFRALSDAMIYCVSYVVISWINSKTSSSRISVQWIHVYVVHHPLERCRVPVVDEVVVLLLQQGHRWCLCKSFHQIADLPAQKNLSSGSWERIAERMYRKCWLVKRSVAAAVLNFVVTPTNASAVNFEGLRHTLPLLFFLKSHLTFMTFYWIFRYLAI